MIHRLSSFSAGVFLLFSLTAFSQQYLIKFATLAPDGSTWMNVMKEYDDAVRKESGGRLGFKIYSSGKAGDEKDVLRKIRLGQFHSAGFTGVGLGEIAPKVRILDSPFLFESYDEVDEVYRTFDKEFTEAFEENGFVLLGWAEVGFVYIFSKTPIFDANDVKKNKMWIWEGDPIAEAAFKSLNVSPIPLPITDVLTSLQTGLVNAVYTSPLAAIALQWFTRVKYMLDVPLADAAGAVVISKKKFDELPVDLQETLLRNGRKYMEKLTRSSREDNQKSIEALKKNGLEILVPPQEEKIREYRETGLRARRMLVGKLYTEEFLTRVEKAVLDFRTHHKHPK
jgi:TRAP-type C4-dicarboxylate transport system substrate-binding protein